MRNSAESLTTEQVWEKIAEESKKNPLTVKVDVSEDLQKMQDDTLKMIDQIIEGINSLNDLIEKGDKS